MLSRATVKRKKQYWINNKSRWIKLAKKKRCVKSLQTPVTLPLSVDSCRCCNTCPAIAKKNNKKRDLLPYSNAYNYQKKLPHPQGSFCLFAMIQL